MMDIGQVPFDEKMKTNGREYRTELLRALIIRPNNTVFMHSLEEVDDWFRAHSIDPETIQLTPREIEAAKKRKKELGF